ncbi:MAG: Uma2 family endonuclease [Saprospiraceae bacterium]
MFHHNIEDSHVAAILESPAAPALAAALNTALVEEKKRRQHFYQEIDDDMKAEFINGDMVVHSPVKKEHTDAMGFLFQILNVFVRVFQLGYVGYEKVMTALTRNDYEPDVLFFGLEKSVNFKKGQWKYPPPDFVVEVLSEGTEARDRGIKFQDYEAHGVAEYWIIDPEEESVEQYLLHEGHFKLHLKAGQGRIESRAVPGFSIDIRAIFDEKANLEALQQILSSHLN